MASSSSTPIHSPGAKAVGPKKRITALRLSLSSIIWPTASDGFAMSLFGLLVYFTVTKQCPLLSETIELAQSDVRTICVARNTYNALAVFSSQSGQSNECNYVCDLVCEFIMFCGVGEQQVSGVVPVQELEMERHFMHVHKSRGCKLCKSIRVV